MKKLAMVAITLILCTTDTEAATPPVDLAAICESEQGCVRRLTDNYDKLKKHLEQRGKVSYQPKQVKRKIKEACSDSHRPRPGRKN